MSKHRLSPPAGPAILIDMSSNQEDGAVDVGEASAARSPQTLSHRRPRWHRLLAFALVGLLLVLGVCQLLLPRIAAKALRDKVARYGEVRSASVSALPAVQLLWGSASSASLTAGQIAIAPHQLVNLLLEAKSVEDLTVRASSVKLLHPGFGANTLTLSDAVLQKRGETVSGSVVLTQSALDAALPEGVQASLLAGAGGELQARASGQLFGFSAAIEAAVQAREGKLVLVPTQALLAGLGHITLFSDSRLQILAVSASPRGLEGEPQASWTLRLTARLA